MKKLLTITLSLLFVLLLSACTPDNNSGGSKQNNNSSTPTKSRPNTENINPSVTNPQQTETNPKTPAVTREQAIQKALTQVGAAQTEIRDLDAELDHERGALVWEIDFEYGNREYAFEIDADSGEILRSENEYD